MKTLQYHQLWPKVRPYTSRCSMKDIKALSSKVHPRIGGMSVHKAASTLFVVHNSRRLVDVKWKLLRSGSAPWVSIFCLPDVIACHHIFLILPLRITILQVLKDWRWEQPENNAMPIHA